MPLTRSPLHLSPLLPLFLLHPPLRAMVILENIFYSPFHYFYRGVEVVMREGSDITPHTLSPPLLFPFHLPSSPLSITGLKGLNKQRL